MNAAVMMVKLNVALRVGRITVPAGCREAAQGHKRVSSPGDHLDVPLVISAALAYASTNTRILLESEHKIGALYHSLTTNPVPTQILRRDEPAAQQRPPRCVSQRIAHGTPPDVTKLRF